MVRTKADATEMGWGWPAQGDRGRDFDESPLRVAILLWPSFPLMSLAGLVESLRHAGDHGDASHYRYARWDILGAPGAKTVSSCGIGVDATVAYPNPESYDYVFVIGGLLRDLADAPARHLAYIRAVHRLRRPLISVCTGSFVLAGEGVLDGRTVSVHPYHEPDFRAAFPGHRIVQNRDFVTEGHVTTVQGGVSILPLMTGLIGKHLGPDRSAKTIHQMTLPSPDWSGALQPPPAFRHDKIADPRIQKALVMLDAQAARNPGIAQLARSLGLSERHFLRLFRSQLGRSPQEYLVETKLRAAVWMLRHTTRSITQVAYAAGFSSGANLADHCRKRLGASPSGIRRSARAGVEDGAG